MRNIDPLSHLRTVAPVRRAPTPSAPTPPPADRVELRALPPLETPSKAVTVLAESFGYAEFPQASPDGRHVLFNVVGDYETSQMILMDSDGGHKQALFSGEKVKAGDLPDFLARHHGRIDEQGTWAADGRSIYYRTNSQGRFAIARFELHDSSSRVVVQDPNLNLKHPVETSKGYILGYGGPPDATYQTSEAYSNIFLADPRTGSLRMLTHSDGSVSYKHPSEMKGQVLAHIEPKGAQEPMADLVSLDPGRGTERNLTASPDSDERHPFYNAKVDLVAYHAEESGDKNLWLATPDFQHRVQLTFYGKPAQSPSWSPDGQTLYFVKKGTKQAEGEPFYQRQADIRSLDVRRALKDLEEQARDRYHELKKDEAPHEVREAARQAWQDYRLFLDRYR